MAIFSKGADPEALELSARTLVQYARTCDEVSRAVGESSSVIRGNWSGDDLIALANRIPAVQQQLGALSQTLVRLGERLAENARAQAQTSGTYAASPGGGGLSPGAPGAPGAREWEKPAWIDALESAKRPFDVVALGLGSGAFGLFEHSAGGGLREVIDNGRLMTWYGDDVLRELKTTDGLTSLEKAGATLDGATKILDGRALGALFAEGSKASELVGKFGVLGPIGVATGAYSTILDVAHGHTEDAWLDGASTVLDAGALFAPPPIDLACGGLSLGIAAYQHVPLVHDVVDGAVGAVGDTVSSVGHAATDAASSVGRAASDAWHSVTHIF